MKRVALFPLPGSVNFPGSILPLHIFEPRYRQMITDALAQEIWVGVAHTQKMLKRSLSNKVSLSEDLNFYEPFSVFGAGPVSLKEQLPDGRLIIEIQIKKRFKSNHTMSEIPYIVVDVEEYEDLSESELIENHYKHELEKLLATTFEQAQLDSGPLMRSEDWRSMGLSEMTFQFLNFVRFEPPTMQQLLELQSSVERCQKILELLKVGFVE